MGLTASEEFTDDLGVINQYVGDECGFGNASVTAVDFAFDADLDDLETGQTMFEFTNDGAELHEMALIRINDDTTETVEELLELPEEEAQQKTAFLGVAFAEPGGDSTMFADLDAAATSFFASSRRGRPRLKTSRRPTDHPTSPRAWSRNSRSSPESGVAARPWSGARVSNTGRNPFRS